MIGAFMLFILWMVGLVVTSMELWGPSGSVNGVCNMQVFSKDPKGTSVATLAWLQQKNICEFLFPSFCNLDVETLSRIVG